MILRFIFRLPIYSNCIKIKPRKQVNLPYLDPISKPADFLPIRAGTPKLNFDWAGGGIAGKSIRETVDDTKQRGWNYENKQQICIWNFVGLNNS